MKKRNNILPIIIACVICSCSKEWKGDGEQDKQCIQSGGEKRCFFVYTPSNYDAANEYPLIFALHGRGGTGRSMDKFSGLNPVADEKGFIVCYPDGYEKSWADDREHGPAFVANIDDVAFIDELIDELSTNYSINQKKVYACGMSNGAFMSLSLACHLSNRIAAVAAVTGNMAPDPASWCAPGGPVPVLLIGGVNDPIVPYSGGEIDGGSECLGFPSSFIFWRDNNGCFDLSQDSTWTDVDTDDGTTVIVKSHFNCDSAVNVMLYEVNGMGHTWPQGTQYLREATIGKVSQEFNGAEVVADFLLQFELNN